MVWYADFCPIVEKVVYFNSEDSAVTERNITKFLQNVQKWIPITFLKSQLQSSHPFWNAKVTNEDRRQTVAESRQKLRVLTA